MKRFEFIYENKHGVSPSWYITIKYLTDLQKRPPKTRYSGNAGSNHFYVFSKTDDRWIDFRHFCETGYLVAYIKLHHNVRTEWTEAIGGTLVEIGQKAQDLLRVNAPENGSNGSGNAASSFGVEDYYSNKEGRFFVDWCLAEEQRAWGTKVLMSEALEKYFERKTIDEKAAATTLDRLPETESEWQAWHHWQSILRFKLITQEGALVLPPGASRPGIPGDGKNFENPPSSGGFRSR